MEGKLNGQGSGSRNRRCVVDRKRDNARHSQFHELLDKPRSLICSLGAQEADAKPNRREPVLLGQGETLIERFDHRLRPAAPGAPVRRIDDDIGITRSVLLKTPGAAI